MIVGEFELVQTVDQSVREGYKAINAARALPPFKEAHWHDRMAVIVGGGPSLADSLDVIRLHKQQGAVIWTVNNTFSYLKSHGIQPDCHVFLDSREENAEFITRDPETTYYLDMHCHPRLFEKADGMRILTYDLPANGTGSTVGLKALDLAALEGYRVIRMYGFDSSYRDEAHHAYAQPLNDNENRCEVTVNGRKFECAPWMAYQADQFYYIARSLADQGVEVGVGGDGLLPFIARLASAPAEPYYL